MRLQSLSLIIPDRSRQEEIVKSFRVFINVLARSTLRAVQQWGARRVRKKMPKA